MYRGGIQLQEWALDWDDAGRRDFARRVWEGINLPNLREHIAPVRAYADLVVVKAADHAVTRIISAGPAAPPPTRW